jgi:hypothetical protein
MSTDQRQNRSFLEYWLVCFVLAAMSASQDQGVANGQGLDLFDENVKSIPVYEFLNIVGEGVSVSPEIAERIRQIEVEVNRPILEYQSRLDRIGPDAEAYEASLTERSSIIAKFDQVPANELFGSELHRVRRGLNQRKLLERHPSGFKAVDLSFLGDESLQRSLGFNGKQKGKQQDISQDTGDKLKRMVEKYFEESRALRVRTSTSIMESLPEETAAIWKKAYGEPMSLDESAATEKANPFDKRKFPLKLKVFPLNNKLPDQQAIDLREKFDYVFGNLIASDEVLKLLDLSQEQEQSWKEFLKLEVYFSQDAGVGNDRIDNLVSLKATIPEILAGILVDSQVTKLLQVELQYRLLAEANTLGLNDSRVVSQLEFSQSVRNRISQIANEAEAAHAELKKKRVSEIRELLQKQVEDALGLLTTEQLARYDVLVGKPIYFPHIRLSDGEQQPAFWFYGLLVVQENLK